MLCRPLRLVILSIVGSVLHQMLVAGSALAVVITAASDIANVRAPAHDPGWLNVGKFGGGSAIYLGNRWVITANHVGGRDLILSDGRTIAATYGSDKLIIKSGQAGVPDLRMFQIAEDPGLPSLPLASTSPTVGTQVIMIGAGTDRTARLRGWGVTSTPFGLQWTETLPSEADILGFSLGNTNTMRWGLNIVSKSSAYRPADQTQIFMTNYDRDGITFEAQATPGDSGGAVFIGDGEQGWLLAGLMITSQPFSGQPPDTVVYGTQTAITDLAFYRDEILSIANRKDPAWQSRTNYFDIDGNGGIQSRDALTLINKLNTDGFLDLSGPHIDGQPWYDVNGDYRGNSQDLLALFNEIRRLNNLPSASPRAAPMTALAAVPEPSSCVLAALGAAAFLAARYGTRRRCSQRS